MKTAMLTAVLCLLSATTATMPSGQAPIPLSMMDKSVDDMYDGCSDAMAERVNSKYFPREMKKNALFKQAWNSAQTCADKKYNTTKPKELTRNQIQALCIYTAHCPNVYKPLNNLLRDPANRYATNNFKYHALYFWLVSAIEKLRNSTACQTTYRRTGNIFQGRVNTEMRFGSFASSSTKSDLKSFGSETCFHIKSCFGASIRDYSRYSKEEEVLIPPYEKFKVIQIATGSYGELKNCTKIFVLESAGSESKLNCKAAHKRGWFNKLVNSVKNTFSGR